MPVVPFQEIIRTAFKEHFAVAAFNVVNDLTMDAILEAASQARAPVIIQVSVKTVKVWGARLLHAMFQEMARARPIPASLHLDHCPEIGVIRECLDAGWNSVLFDASSLSYEENLAQTIQVVALARRYGAAVEGELEAVRGIEDGHGSDEEEKLAPLPRCVEFVRKTGIDCFAPAIGTAHGVYEKEPAIDFDRVRQIVAAEPIPIVLHGGTGLRDEVFRELIRSGCAKVNISTMLRMTYADSHRNYLQTHPAEYDLMKLQAAVKENLVAMAKQFMVTFGSAGRG